ncbi:MAG: zinc ribbon domain-containing protein [Oscillospiraceae bacterium]|nr:zinc ribbon domain-containing protein [Oscillospiraceae bacterium]
MSKKCAHCGAPVNEGDSYCGYCGSPLSADADPSPYSKEGEYFAAQPSDTASSGSDPFSKAGQVFNSIGTEGADGEASIGLKIVAFLFPFIGLIIYLVKRRSAPVAAKSLLPWVIAGVVKNVVVSSLDGSYSSLSSIGQIGRVIRSIS